jgi:multidrug efflux pump subunit AcrB
VTLSGAASNSGDSVPNSCKHSPRTSGTWAYSIAFRKRVFTRPILGFGYEWTELALQEKQVGDTAIYVFIMAVVFVFLLLAAQYECRLLGDATGAEMRPALGTVVFFGMLGVTAFGLLLTPVFYVSCRWLGSFWEARRAKAESSAT